MENYFNQRKAATVMKEVMIDFRAITGSAYARYLLAAYCMPTLMNLKPSNLVSVYKRQAEQNCFLKVIQEEAGQFGCGYDVIYEDPKMFQLLIFRENQLNQLLSDQARRNFLIAYGYAPEDGGIPVLLNTLKERLRQYHLWSSTGGSCFPHEIGILLGYPIGDVEAFISNNGRNYLLSGYWKVYENVEAALQIFHNYRTVSREAVQRLKEDKRFSAGILEH